MNQTTPPKAGEQTHKFAVGDKVTMTNGNGIKFPGKTIVALFVSEVRGPCYYISPTDTPWFAVSESQISAS